MNKHITLSILTSGLLFLAGCGSNSTASFPQENQAVQQSSTQSFSQLETRHIGVNHPPIACAKTFCTNKDTNLTGQLIATDEDGDVLTYAVSDLNITKGTIDLNASSGIFNYAPAEGFVGNYTFNFTATDEHNATSEEKEITIVVKGETDVADTPTAPTDLEVNATTTTTVKLTWTDTSDNESGFVIYQDGKAVKCVNADKTSQVIDGLEEGHTYTFTVRARNEAGYSDPSNEVTVTTSVATIAPHSPTSLMVVAKDKTCVRLKWVDNSDNESGFKIYDQNDNLIKTVSANSKCTTISGLSKATEYSFKVVAFNSVGESSASNEVTVTTEDGPNSAPVAYAKTYSTYVDTNLTSKLCASDADGDSLTYEVEDNPTHGIVELNTTSGEFTYTPESGYIGDDEFTFSASDETNSSEVKTATIKICEK
jgi:hypothetical protein